MPRCVRQILTTGLSEYFVAFETVAEKLAAVPLGGLWGHGRDCIRGILFGPSLPPLKMSTW
jgi:hypothetical protein